MSFPDFIKAQMGQCECPKRTTQTVVDAIIEHIENNRLIVGSANDHTSRVVAITRLYEGDTDFKNALDTVANKIMVLFPDKKPTHNYGGMRSS